jgi:hypothetical protein
MSSGGDRPTGGANAAVLCPICGTITGYKAVPGSGEQHRDYLQCLAALQARLNGLLTGLSTAASKERQTRSDVKKSTEGTR